MTNAKKEPQPYDEDASVKYIQDFLPQELKGRFSNDDLLYLLDLVDNFYETKGDKDFTDEEYEALDKELLDYMVKNAREDGVGEYTEDEIVVLEGEVEYCESIGYDE